VDTGFAPNGVAQPVTRPRIQILSDMVFGLALSIGAVTLVGQAPVTSQDFLVSLAYYMLSFLIVIRVWLSYTSILSTMPVETQGLMDLNVLLLFTVSIEPYIFREVLISSGDLWSTTSAVFSLDLAAMFAVLAVFAHYLGDEDRKLVPESLFAKHRRNRNYLLLTTAVLLVSLIPIFGTLTVFSVQLGTSLTNIHLRVIVWIFVWLSAWVRRVPRTV